MRDRLSPLDASFLSLERGTTPAHIGSLSIFTPPRAGFGYDALVSHIEQRLPYVPRYRQKVRDLPAGLARPVWVDDNDFDISYHVRRSALPSPGDDAQLHELVSRLLSRRLDRARPLWELYLVEGLAKGRVAIISKTHQAVVDGAQALELGQVILDDTRKPGVQRTGLWMPAAEPAGTRLLAEAAVEVLRSPTEVVDVVRWVARDAANAVSTVTEAATTAAAMVRRLARPAPPSPLNVAVSRQRRFATARTQLADYRQVRAATGASVNDVVLAVVSGALRSWLTSRNEPVTPDTTVRALVPLAVASDPEDTGAEHEDLSSFLVDLPVGAADPLVRVGQLREATREHASSTPLVGARALTQLSGFAPPTLHAMGARLAGTLARRSFNVLVTNVPGPQYPLYADGARLREIYSVVPLMPNQALTVGVTSYDGSVLYGLNADRDALADVDQLAGFLEQSLAELVAAVRAAPPRAPGRRSGPGSPATKETS
ncbi:wax ester/triacylglycerol synthase family O-acyltransferase [Rhodococcus sp. X156]|uniref:WS/DGAT/MGAT family O-acyltransferase n=1 Tax=Rhodococcus sp. X156 TaxID=2499145 RepID=UPI000FD806D4|nr:wax ester/triacylglycerol synthase family O-acyltransferase [Rhodococcus sp. X156]